MIRSPKERTKLAQRARIMRKMALFSSAEAFVWRGPGLGSIRTRVVYKWNHGFDSYNLDTGATNL
jgi:hypothetical protein